MSSTRFGKVIFCNAAIFRVKGAALAGFAALSNFVIRATGNDVYSGGINQERRQTYGDYQLSRLPRPARQRAGQGELMASPGNAARLTESMAQIDAGEIVGKRAD